jgi:hypothetical protein
MNNIQYPLAKQRKYYFQEMNRGDSFIIGNYSRELMTKYGNAARNWSNGKNYGYKFSLKKEGNMIRIIRIK